MVLSRSCLGVDIAGEDIKVVELRRSRTGYEVVQAARIAINGGDAGTSLWHFLLETETTPSRVVCAVPAHASSVKFAKLPRGKRSDLVRMVRFEAESQIPLPLTDVVWDFALEKDGDPHGMCHVVIGGARKSVVDEALAVMGGSHIEPTGIMISSLAGVAGVIDADSSPEEPVLVLDIGAEWTDLCILDGGRLLACRSIEIGGEGLTEAFAQDFSVDLEEAERLKRTRGIGLDPNSGGESGSASSAVQSWIEGISLEVRRSVISTAEDSESRARRAILIGGNAGIPGLGESLASRTSLRVEIGDPWLGMHLSEVTSHTLRESSASFAVATGLAKAGLDGRDWVNLLPQARSDKRQKNRREVGVLSGLSAACLVLLVILLAGRPALQRKAADLRELRTNVRQVRTQLRGDQPDLRSGVIAVRETVGKIESEDASPLELLRRLSITLPRSVWLSEFNFEGGKSLVLKGGALSNSAVADTVDMLTQMQCFESVVLDYSNLAQDKQTYDFQITCALSKKGSARATNGVNHDRRTGIVVQ